MALAVNNLTGFGGAVSLTYEIDKTTYLSKSFSFNTQDGGVQHGFWWNGGAIFIAVGALADDLFYYSASTPYDISTLTYESLSYAMTGTTTANHGLGNPAGTIILANHSSEARIQQYNLSIPFNFFTFSVSSTLSTATQTGLPRGIAISPDGLSLLVQSNSTNAVFRYDLSSPYTLSGGSYSGDSLDYSGQTIDAETMTVSPDGYRIFIADNTTNIVYQYNLTIPFDPSTATYSGKSKDFSGTMGTIDGMMITNQYLYLFDNGPSVGYQFVFS